MGPGRTSRAWYFLSHAHMRNCVMGATLIAAQITAIIPVHVAPDKQKFFG